MVAKAMAYLGAVGLLAAATLAVLWFGSLTVGETGGPAAAATVAVSGPAVAPAPAPATEDPLARLRENLAHPLARLLLQIVVIVLAARVVGALARRLGQPAVVGEMLAGILLGPSLLGWLWPASQELLFPAESLGPLRLLSQLGVILFMFVVGLELDVDFLRRRLGSAVWVSHVSIAAPLFLGTLLALAVHERLAPAGTAFVPFALFLGVAMSITAFPVLARILEERRLARTPLGSTAIACAAVGDVTAWCLLAVVVAIARAEALSSAVLMMVLSAGFVALLLGVVKPFAGRLVPAEVDGEGRARALLAGTVAFLLLCALVTETIGIHALFGAFLAGVAMPRHRSVTSFLEKRLEAFSSVFLLPLFFAATGLRVEIGLLAGVEAWVLFAGVLGVAVAGKLGGSMLAARATGMPWGDSFALGALMNTRGLIELIVLDLGYELGILSPSIFVMLVLMALATTAMTGPLLRLHAALRRRSGEAEAARESAAA